MSATSERKRNEMFARLNAITAGGSEGVVKELSVILKADIEQLMIRTKEGQFINLILNDVQIRLLRNINRMIKAGKPVRTILLKARQFGGSTFYCAVCYLLSRDYGYKGVVAAHKGKASKNLFRMMKLFLRRDVTKPQTVENNRDEIIFASGGEIYHFSADTEDTARSQTCQWLLLTELPYWRDPKTQLLSMLNTMANKPKTFVFIESTARVVQDEFHRRWCEAVAEKSDYHAEFVGWQNVNWEYVKAFDTDQLREDFMLTLDAEELALIDNPDEPISPEQLYWRRWAIVNLCGSDIDDFHREYPSNDAEAFLAQQRQAFSAQQLDRWMKHAPESPLWEGNCNMFAPVRWNLISGGNIEEFERGFSEVKGGKLKIWEMPQAGVDYCLGADVAEGIETEARHGDSSAASIGRVDTGMIVATWFGHIDPDVFGDLLVAIGQTYNDAFVCCEANNHGITTLKHIWSRYNRSRIYRPYMFESVDETEKSDRLGFYTSISSKPVLMDLVKKLIRDKKVEAQDKDLIQELIKAKTDSKGKIATGGMDRLMSFAMFCEAFNNHSPFASRVKNKEQTMYDDWSRMRKTEKKIVAQRAERERRRELLRKRARHRKVS